MANEHINIPTINDVLMQLWNLATDSYDGESLEHKSLRLAAMRELLAVLKTERV